MLFLILTVLFFTVSTQNIFYTFGLDSSLDIISSTYGECSNDDNSCIILICNMLSNSSLNITYLSFIAAPKMMECSIKTSTTKANIETMGLDINLKIVETITCNTVEDCFYKGCQMYITNDSLIAFLFKGQCIK